MLGGLIDYTVSSTDPNNYNKIFCNLIAPSTKYCIMTITCLTTNCNIVVLDKGDFITIDSVKYEFNDAYTNINLEAFIELLSDLSKAEKMASPVDNAVPDDNNPHNLSDDSKVILSVNGVELYIDNTGRLCFISNREFVINDASYNVKMISGMYHMNLPLKAEYEEESKVYKLQALSTGFNLLSPVLYLTSNVSIKSYRNVDNDTSLTGAKIVMRINNSFQTSLPIINNNADFETILLSNDLSMLEFRLVDANLHDIHLLSPLYLCVQVRSVPDDDVDFMLSSFQNIVKQTDNQ